MSHAGVLETRADDPSTRARVRVHGRRDATARAMGIKGLPTVLDAHAARVSLASCVEDGANARAAVDAYSWLHKGAFACARELALGIAPWGARESPYVRYCTHRARMLRHHGIEPVMVFDGDALPAKRREEGERRRRRREALERGRRAEAAGDGRGATTHFAGATDVTPEMARELIVALKRENFEYVVAPYEADAQIAHLARTPKERGGVDMVFTEDSDLVAYGCPKVMFKLEKSGDARQFRLEDMLAGRLPAATDENENENAENAATTTATNGTKKRSNGNVLNFQGWGYDLFLDLCVFSGCDFLSNIPGLGIKKMFKILDKHRDAQAVFTALRADPKIKDIIPNGYEEDWRKARMIFKHAVVYDRNSHTLVNLSPLPDEAVFDDLDFLGPKFDDGQAKRIADGELNPISREKFEKTPPPKARTRTIEPVKFGGKRKQASGGNAAERSFMMNFFTKAAKKVLSPMKKSPAKLPTLDSDDDDDLASVVLACEASKRNASIEIDLLESDDDGSLPGTKNAPPAPFARIVPSERPSLLKQLFSPKRRLN